MGEYIIQQIRPTESRMNAKIDKLLLQEGIKRDKNIDYTCALVDEDLQIIATGSCFKNTLRCMAVSKSHQGEGLMNEIVTHLMDYQYSRNINHVFLYTKCSSAKFFADLGFYEIARVDDNVVFMENRSSGFKSYIDSLYNESPKTTDKKIGAIVMNANPFTLGHQYLVETAATECDILHLFIVSEDESLVPFNIRKKLVIDGTKHIPNIVYHNCDSYIISNATFPSYFQKDEKSVIEGHVRLDLAIFVKICEKLNISVRYVGEEPFSEVTSLYNEVMTTELPKNDIKCVVIKRKEFNGAVISASKVREAIKNNDFDLLRSLVPQTTYDYFTSEKSAPIIKKIRECNNVIHY